MGERSQMTGFMVCAEVRWSLNTIAAAHWRTARKEHAVVAASVLRGAGRTSWPDALIGKTMYFEQNGKET